MNQQDVEQQLNQIQQSTKTSFRIFSLPHELFRQRFKGYYNWHLWPYHNLIHWLTLSCYIFSFIFIFLWQFGAFSPQNQVQATAGIAKMLNYQGKLTDLNNIPQPDASYNFTISIYDAESGGSCLWTWKGTCGSKQAVAVNVSNGIFSVMLGDTATYTGTNALNLDFNADTYYLSVDVAGDGEMAPRKRIGAVGYAYNADTVDGKHSTDFLDLTSDQTITAGPKTFNDNVNLFFGTGDDAQVYYDANNLVINPKAVGSGILALQGSLGILEGGATPTKYTILQGGDQSIDLTYTLPTAYPGVSGYVLSSTTAGVMSWVAQSSGPWTDGGAYLYPTAYESLRVYDSGGTDYIDIAHDGTDATISFANTTALNINIGVLDLSAQTVDVTINNAVDALNFDSNTLSVDALNNMIGIGTSAPEFRLTLDKGAATPDGGILAIGTYNSGTTLSTSGAGTRLMWYPKKAAFRAGYVDSTQWDVANIGAYSIAMGYNVKASNSASIAIGNASIASGSNGIAIGKSTTASGAYSIAMGNTSIASGSWSTAIGFMANSSGSASMALGASATAEGNFSTAIGNYAWSKAYNSVVIGQYNIATGTADSWVTTDQLFVIGNGADTDNRANAVTVLKNGNTAFGPSSPSYKIDVSTSTANDRGINIAQTATTGTNYAGYFSATGSGATANYGIYATASSATTNYAGYFDGKLLTTDAGGTNHVYDVAELIPSSSDVENGDVVAANPNINRQAIKASVEYNHSIIGVIPENPWLTIGDKNKANEQNPGQNYQYLTLAGQTLVKVDTYNGSIKPGDPLTSSANPGYAMKATKAGPIIGMALENLQSGTGKILALVNLSYYNPTDGNNLQGSDRTIIKGELSVERKIITQDIEINGHIIGSNDTRGRVKIVSQTKELWHAFENAYNKEPIVIITPTSDPKTRYYIEATKYGFWIKLSDFASEDIEFNWLAQE